MRTAFTAGAKSLVLGFAILTVMTMGQGVAHAEVVTVHGITLGSFNSSSFSSNPSLLGLTFNGTSFPNPLLDIDTTSSTVSILAPTINLGSVTLSGTPATYTGNTFDVALTFSFLTPPSSIISFLGDSEPTFAGFLTGTVQSSADGSVTIDFDNGPSIFTVLLDDIPIGIFIVAVDDITIQPGQTVNIVGATQSIPEPTTLLMLSTGLAAVGAAVRKRRKT